MVEPIPAIRRVLAVTDLSPFGNAAAAWAYAIAPSGSTVHLCHVFEVHPLPSPLYAHYSPGRHVSAEERRAAIERCRSDLAALEPANARERGVRTSVEVVEAEDVSEAILRTAREVEADVLCLGTHGRTGLVGALPGSVAKAVLHHATRPVLLVPAR
ncbi:MAG TPA: universal stress protein [Myxococcota bacterium]|jgi:nucleotide-binding universal stress UspA family protein|nr:universal stress protein [Myxococcota bacterium]